ncbi:hypothetical protein AAHE18_18G128200 [Arachis hypogaea]
MQALLHRSPLIRTSHSSFSAMASSFLTLPSLSLNNFPSSPSNAHSRTFNLPLLRSRVFMSVASGSQVSVLNDAPFSDYKPSNAFLFPGQGAQAVGMGKEAQNVPAAAVLYKKANEILGQPAIYVTSLAAVELLRARDGGQQIIDSVDVTCGLSLGEYTALAFAGAFSIPHVSRNHCKTKGIASTTYMPLLFGHGDLFCHKSTISLKIGLKLVELRGEAMQDAADAAKSAMVSVIGLDLEKVQQLCDAANQEVPEAEKVQIANYLCPGNYAVSGGLKGVEVLETRAKSFKARMTVRLAVAGAFHTSFMEPAVSRLEAALAATEIRTPRIPVISNVDAQPHADPDTIKKILARQVTSPVQWETTVKTLLNKGLKKSYELGPGKVIAGIIKRVDKGADIENIGA